MKLRDRIEETIQKRAESSLIKLIENKSSKEKINKAFDKIRDKIGFVKKYPLYMGFIEEKVMEILRNDISIVDSDIFFRLSDESKQELQDILYNEVISGKLNLSKEILDSISIKNSSFSLKQKKDIFERIDIKSNIEFLSSIFNDSEMKQIVTSFLLESDEKDNHEATIDKNISNIILKNYDILSKDSWKSIITELSKVHPEKAQKLLETVIPEEEKSEFVEIIKRQYVYNMFPDSLGKELLKISRDDLFDKYRMFRNKKIPKNQHIVAEISASIQEFLKDREIISMVLESEIPLEENKLYLLKEYINDRSNATIPQITSLEDLEKYPETIYNRQQAQIQEGRNGCRDVIVKNLTGFSSIEFENIRQFFLRGHDIDKIFKANNINPEIYKIIDELIEFTDSLDEQQIVEFAQNISKRNYNELTSGKSTLISTRDNFYTRFSNIVSEYGKEFNSELGYSLKEKTDDGIKELQGKFTILVSQQSVNTDLNEKAKRDNEHICMSVLTEGNYNVYGLPDAINYVFDEIPEDLMIFSSHTNVGSKFNFGDYNIPKESLLKKSNFRTAENTSLSAGESTYDQIHSNTESIYYMSGFDQEGNFIQIKPKAIALFGDEHPSEELIQKAANMGIDIVRIPDMQQNLSYMLENGQVTPSLVKGIEGSYDRILTILEQKDKLGHEDFTSLKMMKEKVDNPELFARIESLLQKKEISFEEIEKKVGDVTIGDLKSISKETREFYAIINNPEIERGE